MEVNKLLSIVQDYYPEKICLNDPGITKTNQFRNLIKKCVDASADYGNWSDFLAILKELLAIEITDCTALNDFNPSFIAVFIINGYSRPKPIGYEPLQLVLKISILAPMYLLYFDNFSSDQNKRLIKFNPGTDDEINIVRLVSQELELAYSLYTAFEMKNAFYYMNNIGDLSNVNPRKPYLDECIFGLYLSMHPHNILVDRLQLF